MSSTFGGKHYYPKNLIRVTLIENLWFQQDGESAYKKSPMKPRLVTEFGNQIIGYRVVIDWPLRSIDLIPLNF
ncbi:hypothetical protein TNCV_2809891 [Trichonephila clavipes]|nr:hypothetical protein TNCV_2809891 [Trichonephila clavipes]